jgi:hypothetical protein
MQRKDSEHFNPLTITLLCAFDESKLRELKGDTPQIMHFRDNKLKSFKWLKTKRQSFILINHYLSIYNTFTPKEYSSLALLHALYIKIYIIQVTAASPHTAH